MMKPTDVNDLSYYLRLRYKIELIPEEDVSWGVVIPDLPGCVAGGNSIAEALEVLEDAKLRWLTSRLKHGDPIPEPSLSIKSSAA
jgi:predicted RNase H-like HicB family nuclease